MYCFISARIIQGRLFISKSTVNIMSWSPTKEQVELAKAEAGRVLLANRIKEFERLFQLILLLQFASPCLLWAVMGCRYRASVAGHRTSDHGLPYKVVKIRKLVD